MCALCGSKLGRAAFPYEFEWNGATYTYRHCSSCGTVTVDPLPSEADLERIFAYGNYHAIELGADDRRTNERSLRLLRELALEEPKLLDVGCGTGSFLRAASADGFDCRGTEYEKQAVERAAARSGVEVSSLESVIGLGERFDVVRLADVLTATTDPRAMLRSVEQLIAPGGFLLIEGGIENNPSLTRFSVQTVKAMKRLLGSRAPAVRPPTLLWRTDAPTMKQRLLDDLGFRIRSSTVFDDGWPLLVEGRAPVGLRQRAKHAIGSGGVWLSGRHGPLGSRLGNRILVLAEPSGLR